MRIMLIAIVAVYALAPASVQAQQNLVKAELLADQANIVAGVPFTVAVKLTITSGWHTYWINPGDSGLPTTVKWNLPDGFTAEPLQYPAPKRIDLPGGLINYGYLDQAVFMARITPPKDLPASDEVPIEAKVSWLVCKDRCIKGGAVVRLSLPVAAQSQAANESDFAKWQKMIPASAEKLSDIKITADPIDLSSGTGKTEIKATIPLKDCIAIPGPSDTMTLTCGPPTVTDLSTSFPIQAKLLAGQKTTDASFIVLIVPKDSSAGGYQVTVPIAQTNNQANNQANNASTKQSG
jgi:DsbC/DsbD-like thiol-disulfide interchange protein